MKKEREVKKVVTHRMHLTSLEDFIEGALGQLPRKLLDCGEERVREGFRRWLARLCDDLAFSLEMDFQTAAKRGIEEAGKLVRDPDYYETVKRRRSRERAKTEAWRREAEETRARHERGEYTVEERAQILGRAQHDVQYHEKALEQARARLLELQANPGAPLRRERQAGGDDDTRIDWGDADF